MRWCFACSLTLASQRHGRTLERHSGCFSHSVPGPRVVGHPVQCSFRALHGSARLTRIQERPTCNGRNFGLIGYGFVEQVIFGSPPAAWLLSPGHQRRRALAWSAIASLTVLAVYVKWPGHSDPTAVPLLNRLVAPAQDLQWYVKYPAVGFGLHSIPVAFLWALPMSVVVVAAAALAGAWIGSPLFRPTPTSSNRAFTLPGLGAFLAVIVLINVPLLTTLPHPSSPRTFTPTWLALVIGASIAGSRIQWKQPRVAGASIYVLMSGSLLSIALSVSVRVRTADFTEASSKWVAERVPNGGSVLICERSSDCGYARAGGRFRSP